MCQVPEVQSVGTAIIIMCFVITNFVIEHFAYISVGAAIIIMCIVITNSVRTFCSYNCTFSYFTV